MPDKPRQDKIRVTLQDSGGEKGGVLVPVIYENLGPGYKIVDLGRKHFLRSIQPSDTLPSNYAVEERNNILEFLSAISAGIDPRTVPLTRYFPTLFLIADGGSRRVNLRMFNAFRKLMKAWDLSAASSYPIRFGSLDYRPIYTPKAKMTHEEGQELLSDMFKSLAHGFQASSREVAISVKLEQPLQPPGNKEREKAEIRAINAKAANDFANAISKVAGVVALVIGGFMLLVGPKDKDKNSPVPVAIQQLAPKEAFGLWSSQKDVDELIKKLVALTREKDEADDETEPSKTSN